MQRTKTMLVAAALLLVLFHTPGTAAATAAHTSSNSGASTEVVATWAVLRSADNEWANIVDDCAPVMIAGGSSTDAGVGDAAAHSASPIAKLLNSAAAIYEEAMGLRNEAESYIKRAERAEKTLRELKERASQYFCDESTRQSQNETKDRNARMTEHRATTKRIRTASAAASVAQLKTLWNHAAGDPTHHAQVPKRAPQRAQSLIAASGASVVDVATLSTTMLRGLFDATGGEECWKNVSGWADLTSEDPCLDNWFGVSCNQDTGAVLALDLSDNGLCGALPDDGSLAQLEGLRMLDLSHNAALGGELPASLPTTLTHLDLCCNPMIKGPLPPDYSLLHHIETLYLSYNPGLRGSLPFEYGTLSNARSFNLHHCPGLTGTLPSEYSQLRAVQRFRLDGNSGLTGTLPTDYGKLTNAETIGLHSNVRLKGTLPSEFGALTNARYFYAYSNPGLEGTLPSDYGALTKVQEFYLYSNPGLKGTLPSEYGLLEQVQYFSLNSNTGLNGTLPTDYGRLTNMLIFDLVSMGAALRGTLPAQYSALTNVQFWLLSNSGLEGTLPSQYSALANVKLFGIYSNPRLKGTLPSEWSTLLNVQQLYLQLNDGLRGTLPSEWSTLSSMQQLSLHSNRGLRGTLPSEWSTLSSMQQLSLHSNSGLNGTLPSQWGLLQSVQTLDLHACVGMAGATIPEDWALNLTSLEVLDLSAIGLEGDLPASWLGRDLDFFWDSPQTDSLNNGMVFDIQSEARLDPNPVLPAARKINLAGNCLTQNAGSALRRTSTLQSLALLDISDNALRGGIDDKDMYAVGVTTHNPKLDPGAYSIATFPRLVSLRLANNRIERLPGTSWLDSNNRSSAALLTVLYASGNALCTNEPLANIPYANIPVLDLSDNPAYAPGDSELPPSFMVFDTFTMLPQEGRNCSCPGVTRFNVTDRNVAWTLDPHYYNYSACTCNPGFGGVRCECDICAKGEKSVDGECKKCPGHSYSNKKGLSECTVCKPGTCHGHGSCVLAADDNLDGSTYECSCDFTFRGSVDCAVPIVGVLLGIGAGLVLWLAYRKRRAILERLKRREKEATDLRFMMGVAEKDINSLKQGWRIEEHDLTFGKVVASGGFGQVFRGTWMGRTVAIKEIFPLPSTPDGPQDAADAGFDEDEVAVMLRHRHPRLVLFFGCGRRASNGRRFLVVEWMAGGSLYDQLHASSSPPPWAWRVEAALDVALAVKYLHGAQLVHRDIKSMKPVCVA